MMRLKSMIISLRDLEEGRTWIINARDGMESDCTISTFIGSINLALCGELVVKEKGL